MAQPTLLAFHGSGSNSTIHTIQLARLTRPIKPTFAVSSLTGPIDSAAGPGILPFFEGCGPYYRWIPPTAPVAKDLDGADMVSLTMVPELEALVKKEVEDVRNKGGKVVGVIGFSQGTRVVAGLLKAAQIQKSLAKERKGEEGLDWLADIAFGVSMCSSFPPPVIPSSVVDAVKTSGLSAEKQNEILKAKIELPTLHILGNQDEWQWAGKLIIESAFEIDQEPKDEVEKGKSGVYMFNMGHHYPVETEDTKKVADWILGTWNAVKHT